MWEILESPWLVMPSKVWTPPSRTVRGPPLSPWYVRNQKPQSRYFDPTLLVPRPSPPAHSIELWISVSFPRRLSWQPLLLRIGTWIVVERSVNDLGNSVL